MMCLHGEDFERGGDASASLLKGMQQSVMTDHEVSCDMTCLSITNSLTRAREILCFDMV